jgi:hypothetical protein
VNTYSLGGQEEAQKAMTTIVFAPLAQLVLASKSGNICRQSISPEGSFLYFLLILSKKLSSASARQLVVYH